MKKVGYSLYVHKSNINELLVHLDTNLVSFLFELLEFAQLKGIPFEVVKVNKQNRTISLIDSPDWIIANEPTVGDSWCFKDDFSYKVIKGGIKVYHNKWQFVSKDYTDFDIERAKRRTEEWNSIPDIKKHKSRIGNKAYWIRLLELNNIQI